MPEVTSASIKGLQGLKFVDKTVEGTPTLEEARDEVFWWLSEVQTLNIPIIELPYQVTSHKCIITFQNGHFRWCWKVGRIGCTWVSIEKTNCLVASNLSIDLPRWWSEGGDGEQGRWCWNSYSDEQRVRWERTLEWKWTLSHSHCCRLSDTVVWNPWPEKGEAMADLG